MNSEKYSQYNDYWKISTNASLWQGIGWPLSKEKCTAVGFKHKPPEYLVGCIDNCTCINC